MQRWDRLSTRAAYNSITNYIEIGRKEGKVVFGGTYSDAEGYYIDPTVIRDIKRDARIANEEIFGPVLAVIKVDSFDEALDVANQTEYGLTGSVYSETRENIQRAKVEFQVGNLYFNRKSTAAKLYFSIHLVDLTCPEQMRRLVQQII